MTALELGARVACVGAGEGSAYRISEMPGPGDSASSVSRRWERCSRRAGTALERESTASWMLSSASQRLSQPLEAEKEAVPQEAAPPSISLSAWIVHTADADDARIPKPGYLPRLKSQKFCGARTIANRRKREIPGRPCQAPV